MKYSNKYSLPKYWNLNYHAPKQFIADYWDRASDVFKRFATYLNILDQDPDVLASMFRRLGIRGKRGKPNCCPVAVYLARTPALSGAEVHADSIKFKGRLIRMPKNVQKFIDRFDKGYYPFLEAS